MTEAITPDDIKPDDMDFLVALARKTAAAEIMPRFRNLGDDEIGAKAHDEDLVTVADRASEAMIAEGIRERWPDAIVIGEEGVAEGKISRSAIGDADLAVIVDPVDGTWNFARGLALFGIIIAVARKGETVAGLLYDPLGDDAVTAIRGQGASFRTANGATRPLKTASRKPVDRMTGFSGHVFLDRRIQRGLALPMTEFGRVNALRCSCHEYRMMALGHADFCITAGLEPWDHAAGALIVEEAGGHAAMVDGSPYGPTRNKGFMITASSKAAWDDVAAVVREPLASF